MKRNASAVWEGDLKEGKGTLSLESGVFSEQPYSFRTRFGDSPGTNPEELIAAAHAGCFSMALSGELGKVGITPERIATKATVTVEKDDAGFGIPAVHLTVTLRVPGADAARVEEALRAAKEGCPVSKLLRAAISLEARLE